MFSVVHDRSALESPAKLASAGQSEGQETVFSDYLCSLGRAGEPSAAADFERVWQALRALLAQEIRRRGLWDSPPSFLGVFGWSRWIVSGDQGDALDELVADAYSFIFVRRLRILRAQLERKPNIEGLVRRCVRNFLYDTQKRQDPLGFRIYTLLKTALLCLVDRGRIAVLGGGERISNSSVLAFVESRGPGTAEAVDPRPLVRTWNDDLLPDLLTARGAARERVVDRLCRALEGLEQGGVRSFRFLDVVQALKEDTRARWAQILARPEDGVGVEGSQDGTLQLVLRIQPELAFEERESYDRLLACVARGLEKLEVQRRTRRHLWALWRFLTIFAAEGGGGLPSRREMSRRLGIPRDRFPDLFATLGRLVEACSHPPSIPRSHGRRGLASGRGGRVEGL